ncbi:MAG TPA: hypothetical protein VFZ75_08285 [Actinomycetota bacterium]|nr:hypothetical protein [Actinomycetota bacterium]
MAGIIAIVAATLWTAFVVETIVESVRAFGGSVVFVGRSLLAPGTRPTIFILCGLAASAGLAWAAAVAYARGRRIERRMTADLDERYQEMSTRAAGDIARAELASWRANELRTTVEDLAHQRNEILAEMDLARKRTSELRALIEDYRRTLTELQERLVLLPDVEDELAQRRERTFDPSG